jgi:2-C-methyl-D-erythritol 4-phosphate cytidylyltransferase
MLKCGMANFHVIIPAAGSGSRMGASAPKQYLNLNGQPLIQHVIKVFDQDIKIQSIHVVLSEQDAYWQHVYLNASEKAKVHYCGGETRAQTVLNGLEAIRGSVDIDDWILVHDAARPGLTNGLLSQLIASIEIDDIGGLLALPLADTLKKSDANSRVANTIPRDQLWQAQTPQMFKFATLKYALESFNGTPTDEAEAIEALGLKPKLVTGELRNLKVTYPQDLAVLSALFNLN